MSFPVTQLGGHAFNHNPSSNAEAEYDRLRGLAREENAKKSSLLSRSHNAYERGDGASAHELSEEGKRHGQMADQFNKQASDYIFRENNEIGRIGDDTIDLHGQFVEEAEEILQSRIRYAQHQGQTHLHVIVGKGNHSPNHIQKIKPCVEEVCRELGLQFSSEANSGRIYVDLTGGPAHMPEFFQEGHGGYAPDYGGSHYQGQQHHHQGQQQHHQGQQQHHQGQQQHHQGQQQQPYQQQQQQPHQQQQQQQHGGQHQQNNNNHNAEFEAAAKKYGPRILRKLFRSCCTVM